MEINIDHELYAYNELQPKIEELIKINDCITLCGLPYTGKSRVIKQVIHRNNWQDKSTFINFETLTIPQNPKDYLKTVKNELDELYSSGKRIFVVQYSNLDSKTTKQVFELIYRFRQSCIETPSIIFFLATNPEYYQSDFINCRIVFSNILYYKVNTLEHNEFLRRQNEMRFEKKLTEKEYVDIIEKSGGISALFKVLFQQIAYDNVDKSRIDSILHSILDEISDQEIELLRSKDRTQFDITHLENEGAINNKGAIASSLIYIYLNEYSRNYEVYSFQNDIYINGDIRTSEFGTTEVEILSKVLTDQFISRDDIAKCVVGEDDYTDYSEAAIDKLMSRLRTKLSELGVNKNYIKTVKGKGFQVSNV